MPDRPGPECPHTEVGPHGMCLLCGMVRFSTPLSLKQRGDSPGTADREPPPTAPYPSDAD